MNLLEMLGGSLTQESSVNNIAKKSGGSNAQIIKLVGIFLPLVITYLTRNAKKKDGAKSLAGALGQHKDTSSMANQISNADTEDGKKILKHILGDDEAEVTNSLAKQTGMSTSQVTSALDAMLPGIMSGISASASKTKKSSAGVDLSDGFDLTDVMGMLGGASSSKSSGFGLDSILGMFGGAQAKPAQKKKTTTSSSTSASKDALEKAKYEAELAKAKAEKAKAEAELAKYKAEQAKAEKDSKKTTKKSSGSSGNAALENLMGQFLGANAKKDITAKKSAMDGSELLSMLSGLM